MANFCASCGAPVNPDHKFCESCGAPIVQSPSVQAETKPADPAPASAAPDSAPSAETTAAGAAGFAAGTASQGFQENHEPHATYQPYQPYQAPSASAPSSQSALSRAWSDFKGQPGLIGKLLLLALISLVPILDFAAIGYTYKWGAGATRPGSKAFPGGILSHFALGFFVLLVVIVWMIVICLLDNIPLLGFVLGIFLLPMSELCAMRVAMFDSLGSGFEISKVWQLFKNHLGDSMAAYWLPNLICVAVVLVVGTIMMLSCGISIAAIYYGGNIFSAGIGIVSVFMGLVCLYILMVAAVGCGLVASRAIGYVIADHASDWVHESVMANPVWED